MSSIRRRAGIGALVLAGLAAGVAPADASEGRVLGANRADRVADHYIVAVRGDDGRAAITRAGGRIDQTYTTALRGFAVTMSDRQARRLAADPAIVHVEQDALVRLAGEQLNPPSWGTDRIDQRATTLDNKYVYPNTASSVTAYVIDSGVTIGHKDFGTRASYARGTQDRDCWGHGTAVAAVVGGTTYGVAKGVKVVSVNAIGCEQARSSDIVGAIDWVTANAVKPAVANLSLGGDKSPSIDQATQRLIDSGVSAVVAAGNENEDACTKSPANLPAAITVGASTRTDSRWEHSNWGTCVDLFAPGDQIVSAAHNDVNGSTTGSGTSEAAPQVAGAAALYLQANPQATPKQVRDALVAAATPNALTGIGAGSPNSLLYVGAGTPPTPICGGRNDADVPIPDTGAPVTSPISVYGCPSASSVASKVIVDIAHTYRGDVVIDLIAPDGTQYRLKSASNDAGDDIRQTYPVNLSTEIGNGVWKLSVRDVYKQDTGTVRSWVLTL